MDLALLTGQRPADVLKLTHADIRDGALHMKQNKTGKKLAIEITGDLAQMIERITTRPAKIKGAWLIQDENGQPFTYWMLRNRFDEAREAAGATFQFRDIRPPGQGRYRYRRPWARSEATRAREPGHDRALHAQSTG